MKSLVGIFVVLIVGAIFIVYWNSNFSLQADDSNLNQIAWRSPVNDEVEKVSNSFFKTDTPLCADYFIKQISNDKYIIACDDGQDSWTYYTVNTKNYKVNTTSIDLIAGITPPERAKRDKFPDKIVDRDPDATIKTTQARINPTIESK